MSASISSTRILLFLSLLSLSIFTFDVNVAIAQTSVTNGNGVQVENGNSGVQVQNGNSGIVKLKNPLQATSIEQFLLNVIDVILVFAIPVIVIYIMYAGFLFVTARGEPGQIEKARGALLWAVVGGVIVLGARLIIGIIADTIQTF
jgi:hypothetical protein